MRMYLHHLDIVVARNSPLVESYIDVSGLSDMILTLHLGSYLLSARAPRPDINQV